MRIVTGFSDITDRLGAMALGTFDGVHIGHRSIISRAVELARSRNMPSAVMTFVPHPGELLGRGMPLLCEPRERQRLIASLGVDFLIEHSFDRQFASLSTDEFIAYLATHLAPLDIVAGFNYSFGSGGKGNVAELRRKGEPAGLFVHEMSPVEADGEVVSSTRIRRLVENGQLREASLLLERHFTLAGNVVHGDSRGAGLGFRTANIQFDYRAVLPPFGVYAVCCPGIGAGVANLGVRPTYPLDKPQLEIHFLLPAQADLYGKYLSVELLEFVRPERQFASSSELSSQISQDIAHVKHLLPWKTCLGRGVVIQ